MFTCCYQFVYTAKHILVLTSLYALRRTSATLSSARAIAMGNKHSLISWPEYSSDINTS